MPDKFYSLAGDGKACKMGFQPESAIANSVWMDESVVPGCMFNQASWLKADCTRPGRIKRIVDIDIPYPRDQGTKSDPRFMELKAEVWNEVYQEYLEVRK